MVRICFICKKLPNCFPKERAFYTPARVRVQLLRVLMDTRMASLPIVSHPSGRAVGSQCGFHLHVPDDW